MMWSFLYLSWQRPWLMWPCSLGRLWRRLDRQKGPRKQIFHRLTCRNEAGVCRAFPPQQVTSPSVEMVPRGQPSVQVSGMMSEFPSPRGFCSGHSSTALSRGQRTWLSTAPKAGPQAAGSR